MIGVLSIITIVLIVAIVLVVAYHLIGIFYYLKRTGDHLQALAVGLAAIESNTKPLGESVNTINGGLAALLGEFVESMNNIKKL